MKEFEGKVTWTASEWGETYPDCVTAKTPGGLTGKIYHEDQIEGFIPAAPDDLKAYVRAEILKHRPAGENEWRDKDGDLWQFRMADGVFEWRLVRDGIWGKWIQQQTLNGTKDYVIAARSWRDRQWHRVKGAEGWEARLEGELVGVRNSDRKGLRFTADELKNAHTFYFFGDVPEPVIAHCCKLLGVEREKPCSVCKGTGKVEVENECRNSWTEDCAKCSGVKLADNQVLGWDGDPLTLRWLKGEAQFSSEGCGEWLRWNFGERSPTSQAGDAWFRANCPIDRFVTDDGRVLEFRMRNDGVADAFAGSVKYFWTGADDAMCPELSAALYKFRDAERGKWTDPIWDNDGVFFRRIGKQCGYVYRGKWIATMSDIPEWKRRQAEAMWRENNPEWTTQWASGFSRVEVFRAGINTGSFGKNGALNSDWPPHTLAEARAKFRANYTLKDDEIWYQGMPVRMLTNDDHEVCLSHIFAGPIWGEKVEGTRDTWAKPLPWFDEAERLEAYDRMRAFYYEKHPGKDLVGNEPVTFRIHEDGLGYAEYSSGRWTYRSDMGDPRGLGDGPPDLLAKLRAWTDAQLAKMKVTFEGQVTRAGCCSDSSGSNYTATITTPFGSLHLSGDAAKPHFNRCVDAVRVTIEPESGGM